MAAPVLGVDVGGLKTLSKTLKAAEGNLSKNFKAAMRKVGQMVADDAKSRANWSQRIPGSIKVTVTGNGSRVAVKAGGPRAPHAPAYEGLGGKSTFRHPVFTRKVWTVEKTRPFMVPALQKNLDRAVEMVADAIDNIL